jgi:hypothetical protein
MSSGRIPSFVNGALPIQVYVLRMIVSHIRPSEVPLRVDHDVSAYLTVHLGASVAQAC